MGRNCEHHQKCLLSALEAHYYCLPSFNTFDSVVDTNRRSELHCFVRVISVKSNRHGSAILIVSPQTLRIKSGLLFVKT